MGVALGNGTPMKACMFDVRAFDARSRVAKAHRTDAIAHSISLNFNCSVGKNGGSHISRSRPHRDVIGKQWLWEAMATMP